MQIVFLYKGVSEIKIKKKTNNSSSGIICDVVLIQTVPV